MNHSIAAIVRRGVLATALAIAIPAFAAQDAVDAMGITPPPLPAILLHEKIHAMLKLDASQEAIWQALDKLDVALQSQSLSSRDALRRVALSELAKPSPNLVLIEAARAYGQQGVDSTLQAVNNYAASLYASLTEEQRSLVAAAARSYYQQVVDGAQSR